MIIKDANVTVMITDMDAAVNFYLLLGLKLKQRWENHYAMVEAPNVVIGLHPGEAIPPSEQISIGFIIDNISEARQLLDANKVPYQFEEGKSGAYVHFNDPDGTLLYFTQPAWKYD